MRPFALLLVLLLAAPAAQAQESLPGFGVGLRLNDVLGTFTPFISEDLALSAATGATFYLPLNVSSRFRLEPELGFGRFSSSVEDVDAGLTVSQFHLGVGAMALLPRPDLTLYVGGRLRYTRSSETNELPEDFGGDEETSASAFGFGPVVGGEHFFGRHFSLGGEVGVLYQTYGADRDGDAFELDLSTLNTFASALLRFYF
ncbi:MAG: outer membrane beta-barrel protein [Rhodothermales bacterium]|nr:outer membrane beta-barrel protein [Rhodothermales bacterium]